MIVWLGWRRVVHPVTSRAASTADVLRQTIPKGFVYRLKGDVTIEGLKREGRGGQREEAVGDI